MHSPAEDATTVSGFVEAPDGSPAAAATVAINGVDGDPIAIVVTGRDGGFEAERPSSRFAVTVTGVEGAAAFVPAADTVAKSPLRVRLAPEAAGFTINGSVSLGVGTMPAKAFIQAARQSDDEGDIFLAPVLAAGTFTIRVPPGTYWLQLHGDRFLARWTRATGAAAERANVSIAASLREPAPAEVRHWLDDAALPFSTTDTDGSTDDIAALASVLARARVIGVGEATHGTREYFRLKHRLVRRLATHHGLRLVAMEANFNSAERIDAWVRGGAGTVEEAMKGLFVVWRTEEVRDLLLWMREWNADKKARDQVGFRGYDVQGTRASMAALRAYLHKVDRPAERALLPPLAHLDADSSAIKLDDAEAAVTGDAIARLAERLRSARRRYVARSSRAEHTLMLQHARVLEQARTRYAADGPAARFAARDRAMAQNVIWLAEQLPDDARVMVWAHNGHVQLDAATLLGKNMGMFLREQLRSDYVAAGFVLGEGTYRAWVKPNEPVLADVAVGPHEPGWVAEAFAQTGRPMFAVDLRTVPAGPARGWLLSPHILHSCGWLVSDREREGTIDALGRLFDVAIYLEHTTSARQLRIR